MLLQCPYLLSHRFFLNIYVHNKLVLVMMCYDISIVDKPYVCASVCRALEVSYSKRKAPPLLLFIYCTCPTEGQHHLRVQMKHVFIQHEKSKGCNLYIFQKC